MIHKKSSSIVKWIFIICIAEFLFWGIINLMLPEGFFDIYEKFHLKTFLTVSYVIHYIVVVGFIYIFYKNYKTIYVIDNTNLLMRKILKTRKIVNYYVYYNIGLYIILSLIFNFVMFSNSETLLDVMNPDHLEIDKEKIFTILLIAQIVAFVLMCGILWLYYRIIYGILLKKLNKNYKELENL